MIGFLLTSWALVAGFLRDFLRFAGWEAWGAWRSDGRLAGSGVGGEARRVGAAGLGGCGQRCGGHGWRVARGGWTWKGVLAGESGPRAIDPGMDGSLRFARMFDDPSVGRTIDEPSRAVVFAGDCQEFLNTIPSESVQLVVTSPPYNIGKVYEDRLDIGDYIAQQQAVITECHRVLRPGGSICWQVGNYVDNGAIIPLDALLYPLFAGLGMRMRNRIVWHFEHGLHCKNRFSGRYETINWFTKGDRYTFHLDPVRVPQKYPGKRHFRGPKAGEFSGNPLGKNPGDVWIFPNVKSNHVEKTEHPCQYPVELVERLVLALSDPNDWVLDPFLGVGSTVIGAVRHHRRGLGSELKEEYADLARERIAAEFQGTLRTRPMTRPVYDPTLSGNSLAKNPWTGMAPVGSEQASLIAWNA